MDELKFKVTGAIDFTANNKRAYYPKVSEIGEYTDFADQKLEDNITLGYTWQNDYLLYFNKDWEKHHLDAMAGLSLQANQDKAVNGTVRGFLNDEEHMQVLNAGQRDWRATGGLTRWSMLSYFGNVNYNFMSRYLFSFNMWMDHLVLERIISMVISLPDQWLGVSIRRSSWKMSLGSQT